MKGIEFSNFRKFVNFPLMDFSDITLMVGRNNSGKSTLVKAVLLVINYLKNYQNQSFPFTTGNPNDVNIGSFDRARCKLQTDDKINFTCNISHYTVDIAISGDKHSIMGRVDRLQIYDSEKMLFFTFNYLENEIEVSKKRNNADIQNEITTSVTEYQNLIFENKTKLSKIDMSAPNALRAVDELNKEKATIEERFNTKKNELSQIVFSYSFQSKLEISRKESHGNFIKNIEDFIEDIKDEERVLSVKLKSSDSEDSIKEILLKLEEITRILESTSELSNSIEEFVNAIDSHHYYYWSAETQKQSALFSIQDNNNALAKAIHDFCSLNIQKGEKEYVFIEKQIKEFEIGEKFELIQHVGEAYECNIIENTGYSISLADKGMGSIQIMTLLFRLAFIIKQQNLHKENVTLIIEEPELNLHPILQEKLMLLFHDIMRAYNVKFIIETHSEYMIRKSQLIVIDNGYTSDFKGVNNMPINVYFFPSNGAPYDMGYQKDGKFMNDFEPGFFNVADDAAVELFEKTM